MYNRLIDCTEIFSYPSSIRHAKMEEAIMMRNLVAVLVFPIVFFVTGLALLPIILLLLVKIFSWLNLPVQSVNRPIIIPIFSTLFLVPGIVSGRLTKGNSIVVATLGAVSTYILVFFILPLLSPLFSSVNILDPLSLMSLLLVILVGAIGGFVGGKTRKSA